MNRKTAGRILLGLLVLLALLTAGAAEKASAEEARNIAAECTYKVPKGSGWGTKALYDGSYDYCWESPKAWEPCVERSSTKTGLSRWSRAANG